jgi:hypothetical protein
MRICGIEASDDEARALVDALRARGYAVPAARLETALQTGRDLEDHEPTRLDIHHVFRHGTPPGLANLRDGFLSRSNDTSSISR